MRTTIDKAGRLVIPRQLREAIGLADGGRVEVVEIDGRIVVSPQPVAKHLVKRGGVTVCVADEPIPALTADDVRAIVEASRR